MTDTMFRSGSFRDNRYLRQDAERRRVQQIPPLSAAERKEVEEAFDLFDADRTGTVHVFVVLPLFTLNTDWDWFLLCTY